MPDATAAVSTQPTAASPLKGPPFPVIMPDSTVRLQREFGGALGPCERLRSTAALFRGILPGPAAAAFTPRSTDLVRSTQITGNLAATSPRGGGGIYDDGTEASATLTGSSPTGNRAGQLRAARLDHRLHQLEPRRTRLNAPATAGRIERGPGFCRASAGAIKGRVPSAPHPSLIHNQMPSPSRQLKKIKILERARGSTRSRRPSPGPG